MFGGWFVVAVADCLVWYLACLVYCLCLVLPSWRWVGVWCVCVVCVVGFCLLWFECGFVGWFVLWGSGLIDGCWLFAGVAGLWRVCTTMFVLYLLRRMSFFVALFCGCVWIVVDCGCCTC